MDIGKKAALLFQLRLNSSRIRLGEATGRLISYHSFQRTLCVIENNRTALRLAVICLFNHMKPKWVVLTLTTYVPSFPELLPLLAFPICWIGMCFYVDVKKMEKVLFISAFGTFVVGTIIFFAMDFILAKLNELNVPEMMEAARQLHTFHRYINTVLTALALIFFICWFVIIKRKSKAETIR